MSSSRSYAIWAEGCLTPDQPFADVIGDGLDPGAIGIICSRQFDCQSPAIGIDGDVP